MKTILIIGGGAAGLAAAVSASSGKGKNQVILLEKNEKPGKKIYISGKGRCNLTNDQDMSVHMKNVVSNPRFLYSAYAAFSKEDIKRLLEENGCPVKTERGGRVFPVSDHASDVTKALVKAAEKNGVEMRLNTCVRELIVEDGVFRGVRTDDGILEADACIAATGGISYPSTGSTGDGYRFARTLGMKVSACYPSLVPMECAETWPEDLSGLSLKNISVRFVDPSRPKKPLYENFGELLFTHFGISGPVVLSASAYLTDKIGQGLEPELYIDLKPALTEEALDVRLLRDFEKAKNKALKNALTDLLPQSLIPVLIRCAGLSEEKKVNSLSREERRQLLLAIKKLKLTITRVRGFQEAVVTKGGISVKEINPSTMECRNVKGLYFAGEVLDVDALTGGFNLQIAWSTGFLAGRSAAEKEEENEF